ncbi:MAG: hypothetical protein RIT81_09430 [Deltaproteobacteria bacterium]
MLRLGPIELAFWHLLLIGVGVAILVWIVRGFTIRVAGTWTRVDEGLGGGKPERITLVQFGPFVRGRRLMRGGFQEYTGILRGRTIFMTRRDHGQELIVSQGFPKELVPEIDGTVTAKLRLTLSADGRAIFGTFTPQKIEFTYRPPAITNRVYLDSSFRRYKLVSREIIDQEPPGPPPSEDKAAPPVRKTV